jgi:hypothetical protein
MHLEGRIISRIEFSELVGLFRSSNILRQKIKRKGNLKRVVDLMLLLLLMLDTWTMKKDWKEESNHQG